MGSVDIRIKCSRCKEEKPIDELRVKGRYKENTYYYCIPCKSAVGKAYTEKYREELSKRKKERYHQNPDYFRQQKRESWQRNREAHLQKDRERWNGERRDKSLDRLKERYRNNKEECKKATQEYRAKNKEKRKAHENARWKYDLSYHLIKKVRNRTYDALQGNAKADRVINMLGCNVETLKKHLESKFKKGMSWENKGEWHIDHIIPCASFDLTDPEQQKVCFHYTNLQPLWAKENITKQDKILKPTQISLPI
jgi:hypothetical protein